MAERVTVHHCTPLRRLPLIEEQGLRTRAAMGADLGELEPLDRAARGRFALGRRVTGWLDRDAAVAHADEHGAGLVTWEADAHKALAAPASSRTDGDPAAYWAAARPLREWLAEGEPPADLEVHVDRDVRTKFLRLRAPLLGPDDLGPYAALVGEVADEDRLSAKALMHLAIVASEGDFEGPAFAAACALAWRDEPDPEGLTDELLTTDPDKVASAALAMYGSGDDEGVATLRSTLEATREWAEQNGVEPGEALLARTSVVLDTLTVTA